MKSLKACTQTRTITTNEMTAPLGGVWSVRLPAEIVRNILRDYSSFVFAELRERFRGVREPYVAHGEYTMLDQKDAISAATLRRLLVHREPFQIAYPDEIRLALNLMYSAGLEGLYDRESESGSRFTRGR
jgi:hypothetical protein